MWTPRREIPPQQISTKLSNEIFNRAASRQEAIPHHQFIGRRQRETSEFSYGVLGCAYEKCPCTRYVIEVKGDDGDMQYAVTEEGTHLKLQGKEHPPGVQYRYKWSTDQLHVLNEAFADNPSTTAELLNLALSKNGMLDGCTMDNVRNWLKNKRTKDKSHLTNNVALKELRGLIDSLQSKSVWNWDDYNRTLLLPTPDEKHLIEGAEVKEQKPRMTVNKYPLAFCLP